MDRKDEIIMRCSICGGKISFKNGVYCCESCGSKQDLSGMFENTDVFICYVENDEQRRRTKDSIVAQKIYNNLENANVNTFYQRISSSDLTGEDFETGYFNAINKAKIIVLLAGSTLNFQRLIDSNKEYIKHKKILPVYFGLNAKDLPQNLVELQALDYDTIGADATLTKNILRILGRENETEMAEQKQRKKKRKRIFMTTVLIVSLIALISMGVYMIFCAPLVQKNAKYNLAIILIILMIYQKYSFYGNFL